MQKLGGKCLFASELKEELRIHYKANFGIDCFGDINKVDIDKDIPKKFDMLCAGFPCQPFSKAGKQQGFNDEKDRGNLFWKIMEILRVKTPEYILLENVQNETDRIACENRKFRISQTKRNRCFEERN